jgi:hypothetical protein
LLSRSFFNMVSATFTPEWTNDAQKVHTAVVAALDGLIATDSYLLHVECSERAITHQLAVHLSRQFPAYHVDCEYNRDGFDVKRLQLTSRQVIINDDALDAITVFPDIIVHRRGSDAENILVIEVKKECSTVGHLYDLKKLEAFKAQLGYQFAVHIVIGFKRDGTLVKTQVWIK